MNDFKLETVSADRDKFRCPICLEQIRNPKYLPCFHTFCNSCIQTYISSTAGCKGDKSPKIIDCPVCRKSITAPRNDISSEEWACGLPQNKLIVSMSIENEGIENKNCMFCRRNSKNSEAKHWCQTCIEAICDDCKSFHSCVPILQGHKIICLSDISDMNDIEIDEPCPLHKGKFLEVFCQDHDQLCCSICFATKHRTCSKVESIEDVASELNQPYSRMTPACLKAACEKLEEIQEEYRNKVSKLNTKKQEISAGTEKKIEEIKTLLDHAHDQWMKQFEQNHSDAIGNVETASDEVKRFATTVQEAKTLLERIQEHGSEKQVFVTRYKVRRQIFDHVNRLRELKIWDVVDDYNQPDTDFLNQLCKDKKFTDVQVLETPSEVLKVVEKFASNLQNSNVNMKQRRAMMAQKDWMKIKLEKVSECQLPKRVYFGLFVDDTKVLLSVEKPPSLQVYDITGTTARCVYKYPCPSAPYGLCHSGESMDKVYVSFGAHVEHFQILISEKVTFKKIETIQLGALMITISCSSTMIFSRSNSETMICDTDFSVKQSTACTKYGSYPFVSSSFFSSQFAIDNGHSIVIMDQKQREVYRSYISILSARGLAFDLQDNVFVCMKSHKLRQIRQGGLERRDINLPGIQAAYNVVLHPAGEKMMILDSWEKFCVYEIV